MSPLSLWSGDLGVHSISCDLHWWDWKQNVSHWHLRSCSDKTSVWAKLGRGGGKISLCNWAHWKHQAWFSRSAQNGKPPSGVSYPVNLTLASPNLSCVPIYCCPQELGDIFLLFLYNLMSHTSYGKSCQAVFCHLFICLYLWARTDTTKGTWKH